MVLMADNKYYVNYREYTSVLEEEKTRNGILRTR